VTDDSLKEQTPYTPTTEEVMRGFVALPYKVDPQREGESFADWLSRCSIETMHSDIASEAAARRWLAAHEQKVRAEALEEYAEALEANPHAYGWTKQVFVADIRDWAKSPYTPKETPDE